MLFEQVLLGIMSNTFDKKIIYMRALIPRLQNYFHTNLHILLSSFFSSLVFFSTFIRYYINFIIVYGKRHRARKNNWGIVRNKCITCMPLPTKDFVWLPSLRNVLIYPSDGIENESTIKAEEHRYCFLLALTTACSVVQHFRSQLFDILYGPTPADLQREFMKLSLVLFFSSSSSRRKASGKSIVGLNVMIKQTLHYPHSFFLFLLL